MQQPGTITINHCIMELEKTLAEQRINFQKKVTKREMTTATRDSRLAVLEKLLQVCYRAAADTNLSVTQQLKNLPR